VVLVAKVVANPRAGHGNAVGDALREDEIAEIARLTGPRNESGVGYTWSDLSERLIPSAVLAACLTAPTKPFTSEDESPTRP